MTQELALSGSNKYQTRLIAKSFLSPLFLYIGDKNPPLTSSGIESCATMLLIKSSK
jgi:hypothetical protein